MRSRDCACQAGYTLGSARFLVMECITEWFEYTTQYKYFFRSKYKNYYLVIWHMTSACCWFSVSMSMSMSISRATYLPFYGCSLPQVF